MGGIAEQQMLGFPPPLTPPRQGEGDRLRKEDGKTNPTGVPSVLADIPLALPALTRAIKLQNKAARVGFDWPSLAPVFDKLKEEFAELEAEVSSAPSADRTQRATRSLRSSAICCSSPPTSPGISRSMRKAR